MGGSHIRSTGARLFTRQAHTCTPAPTCTLHSRAPHPWLPRLLSAIIPKTAEEAHVPLRYPVRITLAGLATWPCLRSPDRRSPARRRIPAVLCILFGGSALALSWERPAPTRRPRPPTPLRQNLWIFAPVLFFAAMIAVRGERLRHLPQHSLRAPAARRHCGLPPAPVADHDQPARPRALARFGAGHGDLPGAVKRAATAAMAAANEWRGRPRRSWLPVCEASCSRARSSWSSPCCSHRPIWCSPRFCGGSCRSTSSRSSRGC